MKLGKIEVCIILGLVLVLVVFIAIAIFNSVFNLWNITTGKAVSTVFCGAANNGTFTTTPTTDLCTSAGYLDGSVTTTSTGWTWTCAEGMTGGATKSYCSANKQITNTTPSSTSETAYTCISPNTCKSSCMPNQNQLTQYECPSGGICCGTGTIATAPTTTQPTTPINIPEETTQETEKANEMIIKSFDYLRTEQAAQKVALTNFKKNSLPAEKHPVVLYTDINVIKDRITREPYATWYKEIKEKNEWVVNYDISKFSRLDKSKYSKIMAFVYAVEKSKGTYEENKEAVERYGNTARNLLFNINSGLYNENEEVEGLIWSSESYDMLEGASYNFEKEKLSVCKYDCSCKRVWTWKNFGGMKCNTCYGCEKYIKDNLNSQMKNLGETNIGGFNGDDLATKNNLYIRKYSAVGIAALVLHNGDSFNKAMSGGTILNRLMSYKSVSDIINHQLVDYNEGGWAEGPYYMRYAFLGAIPFMKAMENANVENDWLQTTSLKNLIDWSIKIRMPNGARPPFDDSNMDSTYFFSGYLNNPLYNWDWVNSDKPYYSNDWGVNKIDNICYYDDSIGEKEPDWNPTQILAKAGQMIFRSDWKNNAVYLAFLGENGRAVERGYLHEHPDAMSFMLYAYGKYLAIDSGYINWDKREETNNAEDHNVVLANGMLLSDSYIKEDSFFSTKNLDYGEISDNSVHERGILFVDKQYFLVFDILKTSSPNSYEWIMHGNGLISDETARKYSTNSGEWNQDNVGLLAHVLTKSEDSVSFKTGIDSENYGISSKHTYMSVIKSGEDVGFLSLLYPSETRTYPEISTDKSEVDIMKLQKDDWKGIAFVNENNKLVSVKEINLQTNAGKLFVKTDLENNIQYIFADDVKQILLNGNKLFESEKLTTISIVFNENSIKIYYNNNGEVMYYGKSSNILYNGQNRDELYSNGIISL